MRINIQTKNKVEIKNRAQLNDTLYKMLNAENIAVYLIFTLVIIIALFNLIGALIMMILDKRSNLKTLYNLGSEVKDLKKIFLLQGSLLTIIGGIIGLVLGIIGLSLGIAFTILSGGLLFIIAASLGFLAINFAISSEVILKKNIDSKLGRTLGVVSLILGGLSMISLTVLFLTLFIF